MKYMSNQHLSKRPSTKRQAPSPPGHARAGRRVVSSDREERLAAANSRLYHPETNGGSRRVLSSDRVMQLQQQQQHPPARKHVMRRRTSMGDVLDSSYSESEGFNGEQDQVGSNASLITHAPSLYTYI